MSERKSLLAKTATCEADNVYSAKNVLADPEHFGPAMVQWAELVRARLPKEFVKAASVGIPPTDAGPVKLVTKHRPMALPTAESYGQRSLF